MSINRENLECLIRKVLQEAMACLKTETPVKYADRQIGVENTLTGEEYIRLGFYFRYDSGKPLRVSPIIVHESGFAARRGYYSLEELSMEPAFIAFLAEEYMEILKAAKESYSDSW